MDPGTAFTWLLVILGVVIGIISGMLGIGGGVLVIPALVALFGFSHERAVGTSLGMLLPPIGIFAFLSYYRAGNVNGAAAAMLAIGFAVGAYFGARLVNSQIVPQDGLRMFFAFFLLYVAGSILFAHSDHKVWAVTKTLSLMFLFGVAYAIAKLIGRRLEQQFSARDSFLSGMQEPLAPDYEI
jgi:uncharacterized membrane protein YfcA